MRVLGCGRGDSCYCWVTRIRQGWLRSRDSACNRKSGWPQNRAGPQCQTSGFSPCQPALSWHLNLAKVRASRRGAVSIREGQQLAPAIPSSKFLQWVLEASRSKRICWEKVIDTFLPRLPPRHPPPHCFCKEGLIAPLSTADPRKKCWFECQHAICK